MYAKEKRRLDHNKWVKNNLSRHKILQRNYLDRLKIEVLSHYNPKLKCVCGFSDIDCLEIDHKNGGGNLERITTHLSGKGRRVGPVMHRWLKNNNYPKGFQVLCKNCNWKNYLRNLRSKLKQKYDN